MTSTESLILTETLPWFLWESAQPTVVTNTWSSFVGSIQVLAVPSNNKLASEATIQKITKLFSGTYWFLGRHKCSKEMHCLFSNDELSIGECIDWIGIVRIRRFAWLMLNGFCSIIFLRCTVIPARLVKKRMVLHFTFLGQRIWSKFTQWKACSKAI